MKPVKRTKELSFPQIKNMLENLKEKSGDLSNFELNIWCRESSFPENRYTITFRLYLPAKMEKLTVVQTWKEFQDLYFSVMEAFDAN